MLSVSQHSQLVFPEFNPHILANLLAGIYIFVTYIRMIDDEINDESLILEEVLEEEDLAEEED